MRRAPRFGSDDRAVSEVIGFVLSFALSAVFLMISLNTFFVAKNNSDDVVTGAELKTIADRVASRIVEAGLIGQEFPNSTLNLTLNIPSSLNSHSYYIEARTHGVYANVTDGALSASSTTFSLESVAGFEVTGLVYSGAERVIVTYSLQDGGSRKSIHIHSE